MSTMIQVTEPTIICMFGDHLPSIEDEFYEELFGTKSEGSQRIVPAAF